MNSVYQSILQLNVRPSVRQLKLGWIWVMQQDSNPQKIRKSTTEWLNSKRKESRCCKDPVKVQNSTWLRCCGGTLRQPRMIKCLQTSVNSSNLVTKSGPKSTVMSDWGHAENDCFKFLFRNIIQMITHSSISCVVVNLRLYLSKF